MNIQCPNCQARYRIKGQPDTGARGNITCPKCRHRFAVQDHLVENDGELSPAGVLIVDDARFFRELISDILADRGYRLSLAETAQQAWEILAREKIDLMIVDVNLPDLNGYDFIKQVRSQDRFSHLAILCISGVHRTDEDFVKAMSAGANDFSTKSFHPEEFNNRVRKLLTKQRPA